MSNDFFITTTVQLYWNNIVRLANALVRLFLKLIFYFVNVKYNELFVSVFPQMVMVEECQQRFPNVDPENTICVKKEGDVYSECNVSSIKLHWNYNRKRH